VDKKHEPLKKALADFIKHYGMRTVLNLLADIADEHAKAKTEMAWKNKVDTIDPGDAETCADNLRNLMF